MIHRPPPDAPLFAEPYRAKFPAPAVIRAALREGHTAAAAAQDAAERKGFDPKAAADTMLDYLRKQGPASGETLTAYVRAVGNAPGDDRAFGGVFRALVKRGAIWQVGECLRAKGHGTAGGRVWEARP